MGRWSRVLARRFIGEIVPPTESAWLDVGCGTGALTEAIADLAQPSRIVGVDTSPAYLEVARKDLGDRAEFFAAGGDDLPFDDDEFDVVASGLVLNFVPDSLSALTEWRRVVRSNGSVHAYVWDYAERMGFLRSFWDAAISLDPASRKLDQAERFSICHPAALQSAFERAGFTDVVTGHVEITTRFASFEDYWTPFLGGTGPAGSYVAALDDRQREQLVSALEATVTQSADGSIELPARAWTATGTC